MDDLLARIRKWVDHPRLSSGVELMREVIIMLEDEAFRRHVREVLKERPESETLAFFERLGKEYRRRLIDEFELQLAKQEAERTPYYPLELVNEQHGIHINLWDESGRTKYTIAYFTQDKDGWVFRFSGDRPLNPRVDWDHFRQLVQRGFARCKQLDHARAPDDELWEDTYG